MHSQLNSEGRVISIQDWRWRHPLYKTRMHQGYEPKALNDKGREAEQRKKRNKTVGKGTNYRG